MNDATPAAEPAPEGAPQYILIKGVSHDGRKFRPSDWVDRLMGSISVYAKQETEQHDEIIECLCMTERDGFRGIVLDERIAELAPQIHNFVIGFANNNGLVIEKLKDEEWSKERHRVVVKPKRAFS